jgi:steroid 5-alpha reductase family enzyme
MSQGAIALNLGSLASWTGFLPWLLATALLLSAIGFVRVVYFISIGYAFSMIGMAVFTSLAVRSPIQWQALLQLALIAVWGIRLGLYLIRREGQASYQERRAQTYGGAPAPLVARLGIWLAVATLYVAMFSPALYSAMSGESTWLANGTRAAGLMAMALGLGIEALADTQKAILKQRNPNAFCQTGIYGWVRYPNYLGEILFWVGNWIAALILYPGLLAWVIGTVGVVGLVLIMLGSTRRLEATQQRRYGDQTAYLTYVSRTPILFPWTPLFTLRHLRIYLG